MLKKPLALTLGLSLLALAACTNGHKLEVRKTLKSTGAGSATTQNKAINDLIAGNSNCLPLFSIVKQLTDTNGGTAFTAYIRSRNLTADAGAYVDDAKLKSALLDGRISETKYGSALKTSALVGDLLRVSSQSDCDKVTFLDANGAEKADGIYDVQLGVGKTNTIRDNKGNQIQTQQKGAPGRLTLKSRTKNITRDYKVVGDDLVIEEIIGGATGVQACDKSTPAVGVRTVYVMSLSGSESNFSLNSGFGMLLVDSMAVVPPQLDGSVKKLREAQAKAVTDKKPKSTRGQQDDGLVNGMIKTDLGDLNAISDDIIAKHFKEISCK